MARRTKKTKASKQPKRIIGVSFGKPGNRQAIYVADCESFRHFQNERRSIHKYAFNPRDIRG